MISLASLWRSKMHIFVITAFLMVFGLTMGTFHLKDKLESSERNYERVTRHLDYKSGGTTMLTGKIINYNLRTFDSGRTWYAIEHDDDWGITILGEAEEVYPGLLAHLEAWDALTSHVTEHGPIDLNNISLLEDVGFEVTSK